MKGWFWTRTGPVGRALREVVDHLVLSAPGCMNSGCCSICFIRRSRTCSCGRSTPPPRRVHHRPAAVRAASVHQLGFGPEGLAGLAVLAPCTRTPYRYRPDHTAFEDFLYLFLMHGVSRAYELVVGGVHQVPDLSFSGCDVVHMRLGRNAAASAFSSIFWPCSSVPVWKYTSYRSGACGARSRRPARSQGVADVRLGRGDRRSPLRYNRVS